jgi:hypothetical protein
MPTPPPSPNRLVRSRPIIHDEVSGYARVLRIQLELALHEPAGRIALYDQYRPPSGRGSVLYIGSSGSSGWDSRSRATAQSTWAEAVQPAMS